MSQTTQPRSRWALNLGLALALVLAPGGVSTAAEPAGATSCPGPAPTSPAELVSYSGEAVGADFSFELPAGWTVRDETDDMMGSVTVEGPEGAPLALLMMLSVWGAECGPDTACVPQPVVHLADVPGDRALSGSGDFTVRTVVMDLTSRPDLRRVFRWEDNVQLVTSLADADVPAPEAMLPHLMYGLGQVVPDPGSGHGDSHGVVIFMVQREFSTPDEAEEYARSEEHRQLQEMIASFRG